MYAVVCTGGKQYRVAKGDVLRVEKLESEIGAEVELADVRMLSSDDGVVPHPDKLASAKVLAEVTAQDKQKKIRVFKYKRRKGYRKHIGHRQPYTELRIRDIVA